MNLLSLARSPGKTKNQVLILKKLLGCRYSLPQVPSGKINKSHWPILNKFTENAFSQKGSSSGLSQPKKESKRPRGASTEGQREALGVPPQIPRRQDTHLLCLEMWHMMTKKDTKQGFFNILP